MKEEPRVYCFAARKHKEGKYMKNEAVIEYVHAREVIDSRGNPTVEAEIALSDGSVGIACAPSGASTGKYEAHEKRDGDKSRYGGKGVLGAVESVNGKISDMLTGEEANVLHADMLMIHLDGSENKERLGANAILAVSLALSKACAMHHRIPLYRYIGGISGKTLPVPMMNILNGGAHAGNNIDIQEFMIMPMGFGTFSEALRAGCEIYHTLGGILKSEGHSTSVGDEGGYAPDLSGAEEALDCIVRGIEKAGYTTEQVKIALDAASSEWTEGASGIYTLPKSGKSLTSAQLIEEWDKLSEKYPIISIEDGLGEDDDDGWSMMTEKLGGRIMLVGDDYFVTNPKKLASGIKNRRANSILVKPNQIGTLTETVEVVRMARRHGYRTILSHRSGETEDSVIADIAVGMNSGFIKTGAPARSERNAKYNRLLRIEEELGGSADFGARDF